MFPIFNADVTELHLTAMSLACTLMAVSAYLNGSVILP